MHFDGNGRIILRRRARRSQVLAMTANMSPCLIGMVACTGAHHLGRALQVQGHEARLMPPQYVKPFVKANKNDYRDAEANADTKLRDALTALGVVYVAGILPHTTVWPEGSGPLPPKAWSGRGRPPSRWRRADAHRPVQVKDLALNLPAEAWQTITWREGSAEWLTSRFARLRVRPAHRDERLKQPRAEEWLMIEWPEGEAEPT